jgi:hypothetical protein
VHDRRLWIDRRYPIHAKDIHQLKKSSLKGEDVSKGFQGPSKHGKRKGEIILYECFDTHSGVCTTKIEPILSEKLRMACYVIAIKVMCSYYKDECTLDPLSVDDFCENDVVFN